LWAVAVAVCPCLLFFYWSETGRVEQETQDVKGHQLERRKIYMRVCEFANHPNVIGFIQSDSKILMQSKVYDMHIKVTLIHV
jgi:hypothetical protein